MIESIKAGYDGLKATVDIAKGISALKTETAVNQAVIDPQRHVLDAQRALTEAEQIHSTDLKRVAELEEKITGFENWEAEKQRYQLRAIDSGAFAYMQKAGMENGEPAMWLCQTCFEQRHKSALQFRGQPRNPGGGRGLHSVWGCNRCKAEVAVYYARKPSEPYEGE